MLFPKTHHLPTMNNHYQQWFLIDIVPNPINQKMALPSTKTPTKTEPILLELFNRAATNLNEKGEIELKKYQKYLFNRE